jgi:hypothetical protein
MINQYSIHNDHKSVAKQLIKYSCSIEMYRRGSQVYEWLHNLCTQVTSETSPFHLCSTLYTINKKMGKF